jgi:hypothetical protein
MKDLNISQSQSKKWVWIAITAVTLLLVGGGYWWYQQSRTAQQPTTTSTPDGTADKTKLPDNPGPSSSDQVPQKEGVSTEITKLEQHGNDVVIEGLVKGATEGNCVAEFTTPNDVPVIGETKATAQGEGATCGPITLAAADFQYLGEWQVVLKVYTGGGKAESPTKTIVIK